MGVAPQFQIALAATFLKGHALTWWVRRGLEAAQGQHTPVTTLVEFFAAVKQQFVPLEGRQVARDRLAKLTQRTSVANNSEEFNKIVLGIPGMTEDEKINRYTKGLKLGPRKEVMPRQCTSLQECMLIANRMDSILWVTRGFGSGNQGQASTADTATPMELGAAQREFRGN